MKRLAIAAVGLGLVGISLLATACAEEEEADKTPTQVVATATVEEAATPVPPTSTPEEPGLPEVSAAECDYLETVIAQTETLSGALTRWAELMENPLLVSDEWRIETAAQLATIRVIFDEAAALDPPESLKAVHTEYTTGLSSFDLSTDLFARGVDNLDEDLISEAVAQMSLGSKTIRSATDMVDEFRATHSGSCVW